MSDHPTEERFYALHEIVAAARANLSAGPWGYLSGGAETETTMASDTTVASPNFVPIARPVFTVAP